MRKLFFFMSLVVAGISSAEECMTWCHTEPANAGTLAVTNCSVSQGGSYWDIGGNRYYYFAVGKSVQTYLPEATRVGYTPDWFAVYHVNPGMGNWPLVTNRIDSTLKYQKSSSASDYSTDDYDCHFICRWLLVTNQIEYVLNGGENPADAPMQYTIEDSVTLPTPTREGYTFQGWYADAAFTPPGCENISTGNTGDRTFYAKWATNEYDLVFTKGLGIEAIYYRLGDTGDYVQWNGANPVKVGYDTRWYAYATKCPGYLYTETSKTHPYSEKMGTEGSSFAAQATPFDYWVRFNSNEGSGYMPDQQFTYDQPQALSANVFTRTGYSFAGWKDGAGNRYADGLVVSNLTTTANAIVGLSAKWEATVYALEYVPNGGTMPSSYRTTYTIEDAFVLPVPEKTGYVFTGWYLDSGCKSTAWFEIGRGSTGDRKFYAGWEPVEYSVAFQSNMDPPDSREPIIQNFKYGEVKNLTPNYYKNPGFKFAHWNTEANGMGTSYDDQASVWNLSTENNDTVYLYAQWASNAYTVAFSANGGEGTMDPMSIEIDQGTNLTGCVFTRDGYGFAGWTTNAGGVVFADRAFVSNLTLTAGETITFAAQWTGVTYQVTLDAGDKGRAFFTDGMTTTNVFCTVGEAYPVFPVPTNALTRSVFTGWSYATNVTVRPPSQGVTVFTAQWEHPLDEIARVLDLPEDAELYFTCGNSGGAATDWFEETDDYVAGGSALQSGSCEKANDETWFETTLTGPGTLTFSYTCHLPEGLVESVNPFKFTVYTNGGVKAFLEHFDKDVAWCESMPVVVGAGESMTVKWSLKCTSTLYNELGWARVDRLMWTPAGGKGPEPSAPVGVDGASPFGFTFGNAPALNVCVTNTSNGWNYRLWSTTDLRTPREAWTQETNVVPATMGERIEFVWPLGPEPCKFFQFRID